MKNIIIMALQQEAPKMTEWDNVFFSGVGKVNAAICISTLLERYKGQVKNVYNFGTAGGITVEKGLHKVGTFIQRDMMCGALGFDKYQTPFELNRGIVVNPNGLCCATSDSFITTKDLLTTESDIDLVDMESYAIAKALIPYQRIKIDIQFHCYKYVSDRADSSASKDWGKNISEGEKYYIEKYEEMLNK